MQTSHVFKAGDIVRILDGSKSIRRVGYPLHYKELINGWIETLQALGNSHYEFMSGQLGIKPGTNLKYLAEAFAKTEVEQRAHGGNARTIHYKTIREAEADILRIRSLTTLECWLFTENHTGRVARVNSTCVRRTGMRVPGYSTHDYESGHYEWQDGYLDNVESHVILCTSLGQFENIHVEWVGTDKDDLWRNQLWCDHGPINKI